LLTEFPKVSGLDGRKMSKSYDNAIYLSDSTEVVDKKIRQMTTDPARIRRTDVGDPDKSPVYQLHKIFSTPAELATVAEGCRSAGIGCIDCKKILIKNVFSCLEPIWKRRQELISRPDTLRDIAIKGSKKASIVAEETMQSVRQIMGLG
jgi:tryptophanyl-tRNA synthetase